MLENIKSTKTRVMVANAMMLLAAVIWGGNFVAMKSSLGSLPLNWFNFLRHALATLLLCWIPFTKKMDWAVLWRGVVIGLLHYATTQAQNYGLLFTTAGKCALITGSYAVIVPLMNWALTRKRPPARILVAAVVMVVGVGLLSIQDDLTLSYGDMFVLLCAVLCSVNIIATDRYVKKCDPLMLAFVTIASCTLCSLVGGLALEPFPTELGSDILFPLIYSGALGVMGGFVLTNVAQVYARPEYASLFMSTESAFGCLFGVMLLGETLTGRMGAGCALVLVALFLSQVQFKRLGHRALKRGEIS